MIYTCDRCEKVFDKKYNYEKHMKRKFPCKPVDKNLGQFRTFKDNLGHFRTRNNECKKDTLSVEKMPKKYAAQKTHKMNTKKMTEMSLGHKDLKNEDEENKIECKYCMKLVHKGKINRHFRSGCDSIPEKMKKYYIDKYNNHKRNGNNTYNINNTTNNTTNNITNNTNNGDINSHNNIGILNNGVINNNSNNITINGFGKEDISSITKEEKLVILNKAFDGIPLAIKKVHYDIPTNHNVFIQNKNKSLACYFDGDNTWKYGNISDIAREINRHVCDAYADWYDEHGHELRGYKKRNIDRMMAKSGDGDKAFNEMVTAESKLFLYTYNDDLRKDALKAMKDTQNKDKTAQKSLNDKNNLRKNIKT